MTRTSTAAAAGGGGGMVLALVRQWSVNDEEGRALGEKKVESCMSRGSHKFISAYFNVSLGFR